KVKAEAGGTATLFVKSDDDYVRVSTNVPGSVHGRAIGTILDPRGKAIVNINKGEAFYGEVDILGKPYVTGYDPIKDASGKVIGIAHGGGEQTESPPAATVASTHLGPPARGQLGRKVFGGANPADPRVEQPTKFDLVVNLIVAMEVPLTPLACADEVIE